MVAAMAARASAEIEIVTNRCIVPATSFCEYADTKPRKTPTWFALAEDRPLFAFAGQRNGRANVVSSLMRLCRQRR